MVCRWFEGVPTESTIVATLRASAQEGCARYAPSQRIGDEEDLTARQFNLDEARAIGDQLHIDWSSVDIDQFRLGLEVELEHGRRDPETDVTHNDPIITGKIALAHLREIPDYYTRLDRMEKEAEGKA